MISNLDHSFHFASAPYHDKYIIYLTNIITLLAAIKSNTPPLRVVNQVVNVARQTDVKNTVIKSPRLAVIDIKSERDNALPKKGIVAFSLPQADRTSKNKALQNCSLAEDDNDENTFLMVRSHLRSL